MNSLDNTSSFILYTSNSGDIKVNVFLEDETIWLTQKSIGKLFGKAKATISEHLSKIYLEGELEEISTVRKFRTVQTEGGRKVERQLDYYNLDAIISVGYRVNSKQATQFRIWATKTLKEFIIKGFVLDDERLKQGNQVFGKDYFAELQAERNIPMKMNEWVEVLDGFLKINRYDILSNAGKVTHQKALEVSAKEYEKFRIIQDEKFLSDFDNELNKVKRIKNKHKTI